MTSTEVTNGRAQQRNENIAPSAQQNDASRKRINGGNPKDMAQSSTKKPRAQASSDPRHLELSESEKAMTVEEYLVHHAKELKAAIVENTETEIRTLKKLFNEKKSDLLESIQNKIDEAKAADKQGSKTKFAVSIEITAGPHKNSTFVLEPRQRRLVPKVGRSTGRLFVTHGISLPEDTEVSTTHGKFEAKSGVVLFTDVGSTNGTIVNGSELEPHDPYEIKVGDEICMGQTVILIKSIEAS